MPDFHLDTNNNDKNSPAHTHPHNKQVTFTHEPTDRFAMFSGNLLDHADAYIYAIVGVSFLVGIVIALGYSFWDFTLSLMQVPTIHNVTLQPPAVAAAIIKLVSDLLLVLIITEVLGTIIHYLKEHVTSLRPFLFIGIISATRGILSISAKLSADTNKDFYQAMIELGVHAGVVLALGITLKLLGRNYEIGPDA